MVRRHARGIEWTPIPQSSGVPLAHGGHEVTARPSKIYLGSKKRVRRITLHGNWPTEMWIVVVVLLFTLFVVVPWIIRHVPPA
jgi:hypothetical protein